MDDDLGVGARRQLDPAGHQSLAILGDGHGPRTVLDLKGSRHLAASQPTNYGVTVDGD